MSYLSRVVPYATLLAALVALTFGVVQTLHWRRMRSLSAAVGLVQTILPPEFARSMRLIIELPEDAPPARVHASDDTVTAIYLVTHVYESLGVLVFYRLLPLHLVDHLIGGYVRASWRRLHPYIEERRSLLGPMFGEWFQWLAERMMEYPVRGNRLGAAETYRHWRR